MSRRVCKFFVILIPILALLIAATSAPAAAQGFKSASCTSSGADVTLTTTAETVIITSPVVPLPFDTGDVTVFAWAQLTTGTSTTTVTPRIRRGTSTSSTLIGEANAEAVKAAAGSIEPFYALQNEQLTQASVQYSLTLAQASAAANGTALQASICVIVR